MIRIAILIALFVSNIVSGQSAIVSEEITLWNDSIQLPGTLTYNKTLEKQPLVIFVQGSGNPDRNGNQPQANVTANYIKMLRDSLNKQDIGFFSYDKRNVTKANIKHLLKGMTFKALVDDVNIVISHFKDQNRFNSITIIGHSQGSLVGMLAINNKVDKYISLAGLGETMDKTLVTQISGQNEQFGQIAQQHIDELKTTGTIKEINPFLMSIFAEPNHEFLKSYFKFDPAEEIKKIAIPILILNGDKDSQVPEIHAENLHKANPRSKLVIIKNMNHVLKQIDVDSQNMQSYFTPDFPLAKGLVDVIALFIKE